MKDYQQPIQKIVALPWEDAKSEEIIYTSLVTGSEFAESLRVALKTYPESKQLQKMASGEIDTENLQQAEYMTQGDHADFLWYFFEKQKLMDAVRPELPVLGKAYIAYVRTLSSEYRAMTVFSREHELPKVFEKILTSRDWEKEGLSFYKHYLEKHIGWDGGDGGHADLVSDFPLDDEVLTLFWQERLKLYQALFS